MNVSVFLLTCEKKEPLQVLRVITHIDQKTFMAFTEDNVLSVKTHCLFLCCFLTGKNPVNQYCFIQQILPVQLYG